MKKISQYILIIIASIILPTFSFPSLAKDCPAIPKTIKVLTVKTNIAKLRQKPNQNSKLGPKLFAKDKLKVLSSKPIFQQYCWYKVSLLNNKNKGPYWIADVGISEFPFLIKSPKVTPSKQYQENTNQPTNFSILIIFIGLGVLFVSGIIFSVYCISLFKEYDKQIETLQEILEDSEKQIKSIQNTVEKLKQQIENQFNNQIYLNPQFNQLLEVIKNIPQYKSLFLSPQIKELVTQFNYQNRDLFNDLRFQPLKLTKQHIQGDFDSTFSRILQLESCIDNSQASYLKFEIDREYWLIPNITSPYISHIMRNLDENRDIFVIHPGSGTLKLVRPAKIKNITINFDVWEIEEPGEFTQQDIIPEINLQSFHNLASQNITSMPASSAKTINPKEIDLGIIYYLRKNENASFIDLLSNLQCDKQPLRDRLLILQEEEFIQIVNKTDENNTIYKML
ncbi:MAG: hypothetical protein DCF12_12315 [Snowella sp.]|nr:MAG: hypothetical protein DCF12_12315 [Snowella sp.]